MAPLALFNEGVPTHFFRLMEVPTMRLPNVQILLRWPSRMHIYGFIWNGIFFSMMEQFDSMGVPAHFLNMMEQFDSMGVPAHFLNMMVIAMVPSFRRGRHRRQSEAIVEEGMGPDD